MTVKVGINGFGKIGRLVLRALAERGALGRDLEVVAVNDVIDAANLAYLLKYDSVQGRFQADISLTTSDGMDFITVGEHGLRVLAIREGPPALPWRELGVDLVIEASGAFTAADKARGHIEAGARKVLVTAPSKGNDLTVVLGVNDHLLDLEKYDIVSNASCTTNCLAPLVHVLLKEGIGIDEGLMTTVHAFTSSQNAVDGPSRKDWRIGRGAFTNIIPASTGAAKAVALVIPELEGKLTGMAFRVPVATVSAVDLTLRTSRSTSLKEINGLMREAASSYLKGILASTTDRVVSSDFIHDPHSAIYDEGAGIELNDRFFKLVAWYDNEWGYSCRVADLAQRMAREMA